MNNLKVNSKLFNKNINFAKAPNFIAVDPLTIPSLFHFFKSGLTTDVDPGSIHTFAYPTVDRLDGLGSSIVTYDQTVGTTSALKVNGLDIINMNSATTTLYNLVPQCLSGVTDFTLLMLFNGRELTAANHTVFRWYGTVSNNVFYVYTDNTGKLNAFFRDGSGNVLSVISAANYNDNNWHRLAVQFDMTSKTLTVWIDSEKLTNTNAGFIGTVNFLGATRQYFGAASNFGSTTRTEFCKYYLSDIQFYNVSNLSLSTLNGLQLYMVNRLALAPINWT